MPVGGPKGQRGLTGDDALHPGVGRNAMYDAFVSYSHAADGLLAPALQAGLPVLDETH